jgi:hypothetical protein
MFPVPLLFDENRPTEAELQIQNKGTRCQGVSDSRVPGRGIYCLVTTLPLLGSRLGGVMVSMLATGPKYRGIRPDRGDGFLRALKIRARLPSKGN